MVKKSKIKSKASLVVPQPPKTARAVPTNEASKCSQPLSEKIHRLSVEEIQAHLRARGLNAEGKKYPLVKRLKEVLRKEENEKASGAPSTASQVADPPAASRAAASMVQTATGFPVGPPPGFPAAPPASHHVPQRPMWPPQYPAYWPPRSPYDASYLYPQRRPPPPLPMHEVMVPQIPHRPAAAAAAPPPPRPRSPMPETGDAPPGSWHESSRPPRPRPSSSNESDNVHFDARRNIRGASLDSGLESADDLEHHAMSQDGDYEHEEAFGNGDAPVDPWEVLREDSNDSRCSEEVRGINSETLADVDSDVSCHSSRGGCASEVVGEEALSEDWEMIWDEDRQVHYYWNSCTGESTWELPQ